jgi:hypothetical protein
MLAAIFMLPIAFIILYAINEYFLSTRNGAMIASILGTFIVFLLYYTIRRKVSQRTKKKKMLSLQFKSELTALMLADKEEFASCFKNALADNTYQGITEDKLIEHLKSNGLNDHINIYSINGITEGCINLLSELNVRYTLHSTEKIIDLTRNINKPTINLKNEPSRLKKIQTAFLSKSFEKFAIKYGVILCVFALITPYKTYYILFGASLIIWGIYLKIRRFSQRNQIPYPRS